MEQTFNKKNILHYPQLDTILMVEEFIKKKFGDYKKRNLCQLVEQNLDSEIINESD
ncbi:MAG: hypothetical protein AABW47_01915 [Nanoarchaeota archaeon]